MKYPYIGKGKNSGLIALFYEQSKFIPIESRIWAVSGLELCDGVDESYFENATAKYLANAYGEVKSKEHAEFIVKLADNYGAICPTDINYNKCKFFYFASTGSLFFTEEKVTCLVGDYKQITIPLPPECEGVDEWPKVGAKFQHKESKKIVDILALHGNYAWVVYPSMIPITISINDIEKPKTPEKIMQEDLKSKLDEFCIAEYSEDFIDALSEVIINGEIDGLSYKPQ